MGSCFQTVLSFFLIRKHSFFICQRFQLLTHSSGSQLMDEHGAKRKNPIYSSFQWEIPCCRLGKGSTPPVLITRSIFFSFPPFLLRLRELDFIGCYETVDQQTAEPPKTLWICEYANMLTLRIRWNIRVCHGNEHSRSQSLKCLV